MALTSDLGVQCTAYDSLVERLTRAGLVVRLSHNKWEDGTPTWGNTPHWMARP